MMYDDYSIVRKSNKNDIKVMNIFTAAHLLTIEEIKRLTQGKRVRKGHYLFYIEKFAIVDTNLEDIIKLEEIKEKTKDECTPFEDLESDDFDSCTPLEDLDDECEYDEDDMSGEDWEDFSDEDLDNLSDEELFIILKNMTPEDRKITLDEADLTEEERTNLELMLSEDDEEGYIQ